MVSSTSARPGQPPRKNITAPLDMFRQINVCVDHEVSRKNTTTQNILFLLRNIRKHIPHGI